MNGIILKHEASDIALAGVIPSSVIVILTVSRDGGYLTRQLLW